MDVRSHAFRRSAQYRSSVIAYEKLRLESLRADHESIVRVGAVLKYLQSLGLMPSDYEEQIGKFS